MDIKQFNKKAMLATFCCLPVVNLAQAEVVVDADAENKSLEVITIVGEKVERTLKDSTSSVSVIDEETLTNGQYQSIASALTEIPNVVSLTGAVADIRGVSGNGSATGFNSFTGGAKARVSTLVDGVAQPFVADLSGDTGLWDIEQIEVYRGPQSTINGRNSIAGSVFIKTIDPSFDWTGAARLGYRDQDEFVDTAFALSGPILDDELAFRVTGQRVNGNTYNRGLVYETNEPKFDLNELDTQRYRAKLLWSPKDNQALTVKFTYSHNNEKGDSGRNYFSGRDPYAYEPVFQRYIKTKVNTSTLSVDYQLNETQSISVLASYMNYDWGFISYEALAAEDQNVLMEDNSYSVDGRFNFGIGEDDLSGYIGLAYYDREQDFVSEGGFGYFGDDASTSTSLYGEVSYAISDKLNLIAGGRIEREDQERNFNMDFRGRLIKDKLDNAKTIALPKVVLQYEFNEETTLGISARKGYNAGGGALDFFSGEYYYFDEESVYTYELTSRTSTDGGNVNFSTNIFYNDFDGYQGSDSRRRITNIEKASSLGAEIELSVMVTDNLLATTGMGWLKTEIDEAASEFGAIVGNELNSAPQFTGNIGLKYWLSDELTLSVSGNYVDEYFADIANTTERVAGGYFLTRVSADYSVEEWRFTAFVNNALDEEELTVLEPPGRGYEYGYTATVDPRNIGVSLTYQF